jgi:sulfide dehydrogenase cytochrome subunit
MTGTRRRLVASLASGILLWTGAATAADVGRLLASNCFQCHGTAGRGGEFDTLAGKTKAEIVEELVEMRAKNPRADIMFAHARGYTRAQIDALATYFSRLPKP